MNRVLVVEDEPAVAMGLTYSIAAAGYEVQLAQTGKEALEKAIDYKPDLIVLDLRLPDIDGIEVCRQMRARDLTRPILMLTARDTTRDKVEGLNAGADDYLTKPFEVDELLARLNALLRRVRPKDTDAMTLSIGPFTIDFEAMQVHRNQELYHLTVTEFRLLGHLAKNANKVCDRHTLISTVWGYQEYVGDPRTVDVHIRHLRQKLESDPDEPKYLITVRGVGYMFRHKLD